MMLGSACASAPRAATPGSPVVRPAQTVPDTTSVAGAPVDGLETVIGKIRHLSAKARPVAKHMSGTTIESSDPRLAAALMTLATVPSAESHRLVAAEYARLGIRDAAFDNYRKATLLDPRDAAAYDGLARIWRDWGLPGLGLGDARRAVYFAPNSAQAHNTLGTVLQTLGQRDAARKAYGRALEIDPRAAYALNNLCYVGLLDRRTAEAVQLCKQAIALDGSLMAARNNLALVYASAGRIDLAWNELKSADAPEVASYNMGIINLARQERDEALASFDAACLAKSLAACSRAAQLRRTGTHAEGGQ
jgi:Flp pilus assembly protein TadD